VSSARQRPLAILRPAVAVGVGLTLLLGGCSTGQEAQTASQPPAVDGAQGQIGQIAVRNATLAYPEGGDRFYETGSDAPLLLTIVNMGNSEDELTSVTSPVAASTRVEGQHTLPPQRTLRAIGAADESAEAAQNLAQGQIRIVLEDLGEEVRPGKTVPVTLLFRQAGEVTVQVPVGPPPAESTP